MICTRCGHVMRAPKDDPKPLTPRQRALYEYLHGYITARGYAPNFDEIGQFLVRAPSTVHEHLNNLQAKGWIRREFNRARAIELLVPLAPAVSQ